MVGILNTQAGDRYHILRQRHQHAVGRFRRHILNGAGTQAGLKQVIAERAQADGTTGLGRLLITQPTADLDFGRRGLPPVRRSV